MTNDHDREAGQATGPNGGAPASLAAEGGGPTAIVDLCAACVKFVERAVGVRLDYTPETLPVLDHYLAEARAAAVARPETGPLLAQAAGAYLGEVVRRRHAAWWRTEGDDPTFWRVELESVYLAFCPVLLIQDALSLPDAEGEGESRLELTEEDREAVAARLAELPQVEVEEYFAPSTRLEVIDIAVEAIRARKMAAGEHADAALGPSDYDPTT